jgi:hypothetical protein
VGAGTGRATRGWADDGDGDNSDSCGGQARTWHGEQRWRRRWIEKKIQCVEGTVQRSGREGVGTGVKSSQTLVKVWYICRLTNEYTGLSFSVHATFLGAGTEEYSLVIFLDTEEYNVNEECTLVSYSDDEMLD